MSIVKELNELAKKMTGENPKKKTIGNALDYIEQNYTSGSGSSTNVYEPTYNPETGEFGTIPTNLTIDDFANSVIKVSYTLEVEGVSAHETRVLQVVSAASRDGFDNLYLYIYDMRYDRLGNVKYVPSTGKITYLN